MTAEKCVVCSGKSNGGATMGHTENLSTGLLSPMSETVTVTAIDPELHRKRLVLHCASLNQSAVDA